MKPGIEVPSTWSPGPLTICPHHEQNGPSVTAPRLPMPRPTQHQARILDPQRRHVARPMIAARIHLIFIAIPLPC